MSFRNSILGLLLLCLVIPLSGQIGGAGNCHFSQNPNLILGMQDQDPEYECMKVIVDPGGIEYTFDSSRDFGDRWVMNGASESTTVSDGPTIDLTLTNFDITADIIDGSISAAKLQDTYLIAEVDGSVSNELQTIDTFRIEGDNIQLSLSNNDSLVELSIVSLKNAVYEVIDEAALEGINDAPKGSIAIVAEAGGGKKGLSFYDGADWTSTVKIGNPVFRYTATSGFTTVWLSANVSGITVSENANSGELDINIPANGEIYTANVLLPSTSLDANNDYYILLDYAGARQFNTSIQELNLPSILIADASTASMSRSTPILYTANGNAGVDYGVSAFGGGDGSDLELAFKDMQVAPTMIIKLDFSA